MAATFPSCSGLVACVACHHKNCATLLKVRQRQFPFVVIKTLKKSGPCLAALCHSFSGFYVLQLHLDATKHYV